MSPAVTIAAALAGLAPPPAGSGWVLQPPPAVDAARVVSRLPLADPPQAPIAVTGLVTASAGRAVYLQDHTGAVTVHLHPSAARPAVGAWVEAVGQAGGCLGDARLLDARVRVVPPAGPPPVPVELPVRDEVGRLGARLVRVEGEVAAVTRGPGWVKVSVDAEAGRTEAVLSEWGTDLGGVRPGCRVSVVGVYTGGPPDAVLLRSGADVVVLRPAGWWAAGGWREAAGWVLAAGLGVAWLALMRRRLRQAADDDARRRAEASRLEEHLRQSAKMEAVGRLAGGVAHDFNNLLTVINGCADLLRDLLPAGGRAGALAADIREAGAQAAALTGQLLTFGRRHPLAPPPLDLNAVVRNTARLLGRVTGPAVAIRLDLDPHLRPARADAGLISQVLFNLAVNARDAMPAGGTITIGTVAAAGPTADAPAGRVRLSVADTGEGMPAEVQARVFEPYFTTKPPGQGTGLGLATVYGLVRALGGRVWFDSAVGKGTRFEVELPAADPPPPPPDHPPPATAPAPPPADPAPGPAHHDGRPVVLVVEDDDGVRLLTQRLVEARGLAAVPVESAAAALRVAAGPGRLDVLLSDLELPDVGGRELAERVRAIRPGVRVVFMSGYLPDEADPVARYLHKPFTPSQLAAALEAALSDPG